MGNCFPFSKYIEGDMKLKSSEDNSNSQVESSVKDTNSKPRCQSSFDFRWVISWEEISRKHVSEDKACWKDTCWFVGTDDQIPGVTSNKEEIYFDSNDQAWLESDAEDFQSVTSDSTPIDIGTTPTLQDNNSIRSSQSDVLMAAETSSADMKKQLIELFRDSFNNEVDENKDIQEATPMNQTASPKCKETTPNRQSNQTKPKSPQTSCCLPNLVRSLSSSSEKKKK